MLNKLRKNINAKMICWGIRRMFSVSPLYFIALFILSVVNGFIAPINAIVWTKFLNQLVHITDGNVAIGKLEFAYLGLLSLLPIINYIVISIMQYVKETYSNILEINITISVLKKISNYPLKYFDEPEIYNNTNIAISRSSQNCMGLSDAFAEIIFYIVQASSFIIILFRLDWLIIIFTLLSTIPIFIVSIGINNYWFKILNERIEKLRLINYLKNVLIKNENIKEIKLFAVSNNVIKFIKSAYDEFLKSDCKARKKFSFTKTSAQIFDEICSLIIKAWILIKTVFFQLAVGNIVLYFNAHESTKSAAISIMNQLAQMHDNILYLKALRTIEEAEVDNDSTINMEDSFEVIEFRNVSFTYPGQEREVIKEISFKFERGRTYSIIGLNGAGKTTLIKLLLGLYEPTKGDIFVDGINLKEINKEVYHKLISAVFQDFIKYPFTVENNISLMDENIEMSATFIDDAIKLAYLKECIQHLPRGVHTLLMKEWSGGTDISQGQWQKVAIARCYYKNANIIILDEPFSSIDVETESNIIKNMKERKSNTMNVFITHRFASISMADEIIVMEEGRIVEKGTHSELLELKGKYYKLYTLQLENLRNIV